MKLSCVYEAYTSARATLIKQLEDTVEHGHPQVRARLVSQIQVIDVVQETFSEMVEAVTARIDEQVALQRKATHDLLENEDALKQVLQDVADEETRRKMAIEHREWLQHFIKFVQISLDVGEANTKLLLFGLHEAGATMIEVLYKRLDAEASKNAVKGLVEVIAGLIPVLREVLDAKGVVDKLREVLNFRLKVTREASSALNEMDEYLNNALRLAIINQIMLNFLRGTASTEDASKIVFEKLEKKSEQMRVNVTSSLGETVHGMDSPVPES